MAKLNNKVAIITGGAASIGKAIASRLHADGASVVIAARSVDKGEALAAQLGERALYVETDITQDDDLRRLVTRTIDHFGALHILVNNACVYGDDGAATTRETWLSTLNTNAVSAAILGEIAVEHLAAAGGNIVNIGSISGQFPHIGRWAYPISKATLRHLSRTQAVEYAARGVRVNSVTIGHCWSDPFEGLTGNNRAHADKVSTPYNLMGRVSDAAEVAAVVAFVASDEASYMTGGEVPVDGGYGAMGPEQHYPVMPLLMEGNSSQR
ncbi:SDR family oxidoreductase [Kineobactrum salinum]|uniref:SDR family oxidoreductase n=1 Tax=Kineobactrum salinum TaxID=2708301 RepID=A0A6C0TZA9_9GAMM|nr:SDR family oxidoreductase [Kineobactrum salinum]QIB65121.1 SDR family oxidoreductase [Kineobactrum salinum]